jgi:hypothetical protein
MGYPDDQTNLIIDDGSFQSTAPALPPAISPAAPTLTGTYTTWTVYVEYAEDLGLRGMVPSGPIGLPTEIVRFQSPSCVKSIHWLAECWGAKPILPSWDTQSPNEVLIYRTRGLIAPGQAVDWKQVWRCNGVYTYVLQTPPGPNDNLTGAIGPYDPHSISVCFVGPNDFKAALVGPSQAPGGANQPAVTY